MNKQTARNYIRGSMIGTIFTALCLGIVVVSLDEPVIFIGSFVVGAISLVVAYILLINVEEAGYVIKMIKEGNENETQ